MPDGSPRARRGNYAMLLALSLTTILGFGALAIDYSYMLLTHGECQDVADAASQAALIVLRQSGDQDLAREAALRIVEQNNVGGAAPALADLTFGVWDDSAADPVFAPTTLRPNAVRATVSRNGDDAVPLFLAKVFGTESFEVEKVAVSATRSTQISLVLDITGSWGESRFLDARAAALKLLDAVVASASGVDEIGLTIFTNRYAWQFTEFTRIADPANAALVRTEWEKLSIASKAGTDDSPTDGRKCDLNAANGLPANDFLSPVLGGCYPDMPREYTDEYGTDHSAGILLAKQVFEAATDGARSRFMIVLTDGIPNTLSPTSGALRASDPVSPVGYVERRWTQYTGPIRTVEDIRTASINATEDLWDQLGVHTWVVSLNADDVMLPAMAQGDGYYVRTNRSEQLAEILLQILSEMPLAIVE